MSGQAGLFHFGGQPAEPESVSRLHDGIAAFGEDGTGEFTQPGLVMVHRALHVTPEDALERQPYQSPRGNVITWDGRLDNRDDLVLALRRSLGADVTDVALALAAYERWGVDGFARLVGDWSLAIFDAAQRSLVLASDYMGVRPMYFWRTERLLAWSSSLAALAQSSGRLSELDPQFVYGQLVGLPDPDLTPYRGILSLSPAHAFVQRADGTASTTRFWRSGLSRIDYGQPSQYVEHFREVLTRAVASRLRSSGPVWCEVSGGLDSSSVACVAHALAADGSHPPLRIVSHVVDMAPEADERRFAEEVERHCDVPAHYIRCDDYTRFQPGEWLMPLNRSTLYREVARLMSADSARLILSGRVGDGTMGNFPNDEGNLAGLLAAGGVRAFFTFLSEAHAWSRASQDPIWSVIARSLRGFLPAELRVAGDERRFVRKAASRGEVRDRAGAFLLNAEFAAAHSLALPSLSDAAVHDGAPRNPAIVKGVYEYALLRRLQGCWTTPQALWSHPLGDRELVEFVTAIPFNVLCPAGRPRALQKEALADVLPARIHRRFSKGYAPPYLLRALRPYAADFLARLTALEIVRRGYVDPGRLRARLEALGSGALTTVGNLLSVCSVELWLEAHARHVSSVNAITLRPSAVA
jgi:asparagine synthase (glutamine-hydrolysing)